MWGINLKRKADLYNQDGKLGKADFIWARNHITHNKKRGLRGITNLKKHTHRQERRKINEQLNNQEYDLG